RRRIGPQHAQGMLTVGEITRQPSYAPVGSSLGPRDARHLASPLACRCGTVRGARRVKLLVTGGSGFIGSNFVRHVLATRPDDTVVNLDKLTYAGNPANLKDVERDPRYAFVHGDICDGKLVRDVARGVDAVINFAAESVVAETFIPIHWGHGIKLATVEEAFETYGRKRGILIGADGVQVVQPDLPLFAMAFRNGMGQWRRITQFTRHWYSGRVVTLQQKWGQITVTPNHCVYDANSQLVAAESNPELLAVRKMNVDRSRHRDYIE